MISKIDVSQIENAEAVFTLQIPSYKVEASIIGTADLPPLKETAEDIQASEDNYFAYYDEDELCGVVAIELVGKVIYLNKLIIHPSHFRKGIAQLLIDYIEGAYPAVEVIKVSTGSKNVPAIQFYKKNGFDQVNTMKVSEQLSLSFFEKNR